MKIHTQYTLIKQNNIIFLINFMHFKDLFVKKIHKIQHKFSVYVNIHAKHIIFLYSIYR